MPFAEFVKKHYPLPEIVRVKPKRKYVRKPKQAATTIDHTVRTDSSNWLSHDNIIEVLSNAIR